MAFIWYLNDWNKCVLCSTLSYLLIDLKCRTAIDDISGNFIEEISRWIQSRHTSEYIYITSARVSGWIDILGGFPFFLFGALCSSIKTTGSFNIFWKIPSEKWIPVIPNYFGEADMTRPYRRFLHLSSEVSRKLSCLCTTPISVF